MAETIYVCPTSETTVCEHCGSEVPPEWVVLDDPDGEPIDGPFATRGEAKQSAIDNRTDEAIVLLRADGSVHSEMRPAIVSAPPDEQVVDGGAVEENV